MKKKTLLMLGVTAGVLISLNTAMNDMQAAEIGPIKTTTKAEVKFSTSSEGSTESPNPDQPGIVTPEDNGPNAPGGGGNTQNEDLQLTWVPNFIFGQKTDNGFIRNINYDKNINYNLPVERQLGTYQEFDDEGLSTEKEQVRIDNYVQVYNSRNVSDWTLKVKISEFEDTATGQAADEFIVKINKLQLSEKDGLTPGGDKLATINPALTAQLGTGELKLTSEQEVTLMSYEDGTKSATNTLVFGDSNKFYTTTEIASEAVMLNIPRGQDIKNNSTYVAQLDWILTGTVE